MLGGDIITDPDEINRRNMQEIAQEYDSQDVTIGIFGSHSALPIGYAAKKAGLSTMLFSKKGREETYVKHNESLYDKKMVLDEWSDMLTENNQEKMRKEKVKEYREKFANPYVAAAKGYIDSVIEPRETRGILVHSLEVSRNKADSRPSKKHGIPPF